MVLAIEMNLERSYVDYCRNGEKNLIDSEVARLGADLTRVALERSLGPVKLRLTYP